MTDQIPEFSRLFDVARVPAEGMEESLAAEPHELERLAARLGVPRLAALSATFTLTPWRHGGVRVRGVVEAEVEQVCVVSLDTFTQIVREDVDRFFVGDSEPGWSGAVRQVDSLEGDEPDLVRDDAIDLGELAAETVVLALDPYPRKPGAAFAGLSDDDPRASLGREDSPFSILAKLTKK